MVLSGFASQALSGVRPAGSWRAGPDRRSATLGATGPGVGGAGGRPFVSPLDCQGWRVRRDHLRPLNHREVLPPASPGRETPTTCPFPSPMADARIRTKLAARAGRNTYIGVVRRGKGCMVLSFSCVASISLLEAV